MGYKAYSDSYLMSLTKAQIIELLRVAEHNFFATEEALNNSAKAGMDIAEKYDRAKWLLKAAVEDIESTDNCCLCKYHHNPDYICQTVEDCFTWRYADEAQNLLNDEK